MLVQDNFRQFQVISVSFRQFLGSLMWFYLVFVRQFQVVSNSFMQFQVVSGSFRQNKVEFHTILLYRSSLLEHQFINKIQPSWVPALHPIGLLFSRFSSRMFALSQIFIRQVCSFLDIHIFFQQVWYFQIFLQCSFIYFYLVSLLSF